jgi:hypothetical protein
MTASRFNIRNFGWLLLAALFFAATALTARAQSSNNNPISDPTQIGMRFPDKTVTIETQQDMTSDVHRTRMLNIARQKAMVSDAEKLLALARYLNAGTDADGTALSAGQRVKMAADIEKLARGIKEKMCYSVGNPSAPRGPFSVAPQ